VPISNVDAGSSYTTPESEFAAAATGVDATRQGIASAMASTTQEIGGAVGLAALVAVSNAAATAPAGAGLAPGLRLAGWIAAAPVLASAALALTLRRPRSAQPVASGTEAASRGALTR